MKPEKIREMSVPELEQMLRDLEEERFNLQFRLSTQEPEDPLRVRLVRRDIARVKTIIRENQAGVGTQGEKRDKGQS